MPQAVNPRRPWEEFSQQKGRSEDRPFPPPIYDVHVPANVTSLPVPTQFLESNTIYELEVLALEVSGNQTIRVGFFKTI